MKRILIVLLFFVSTVYFAQPVIDGNLTDSQYTSVAKKANSNNGFGDAIDVTEIVYYADTTNHYLYLGVKGKLNTSSTDAIGIWLNVAGTGSPNGVAAGNALGGVSGVDSYISADSSNYKADFEVDYQFAFNPGSDTTNVYFDAAKMVGTPLAHYQGSSDQSGTSTTNDQSNDTVFTKNSVTWAFNNDGGTDHGLEMKIPFSEIGADSSMDIEVFAFVVSSTAYFSDVTVPGNVSGGNLGFNPDFGNIDGGPFHSNAEPLPVELTLFTAAVYGKNVELNWATATEVNNYGFQVERQKAKGKSEWDKVGFVEGAGNSNSPKSYTFTDVVSIAGKYSYRLKQIDVDGSFKYSDVVEVTVATPSKFELLQNYPNPFNPTTEISFDLPKESNVKLSVFNVLGQKVADLLNEKLSAGTHSVKFDGSNLTSGIYFYKMQSNGFTAIKKMILVK